MSLMKAQDWYQYFVIFLKAIECSSVPTISRMVVDKNATTEPTRFAAMDRLKALIVAGTLMARRSRGCVGSFVGNGNPPPLPPPNPPRGFVFRKSNEI